VSVYLCCYQSFHRSRLFLLRPYNYRITSHHTQHIRRLAAYTLGFLVHQHYFCRSLASRATLVPACIELWPISHSFFWILPIAIALLFCTWYREHTHTHAHARTRKHELSQRSNNLTNTSPIQPPPIPPLTQQPHQQHKKCSPPSPPSSSAPLSHAAQAPASNS
jgi:hypothetical protein